jgi:predicted enzyme related to lactoylglutathione lyase
MHSTIALVEFPADDVDRARRFWQGVLELTLEDRTAAEGHGWQTHTGQGTELGLHARGIGPGDRVSLPYFEVPNMRRSLEQVTRLGGSIVHEGAQISICRDSEGSPFGIMQL